LPQAAKRNKASIRVTSLVPTATAYVLIGSLNQVNNGQGIRLYHGQFIEILGVPAVYMAPDGTNPVTVTVLDEKYR
jgi:hypothetical protein